MTIGCRRLLMIASIATELPTVGGLPAETGRVTARRQTAVQQQRNGFSTPRSTGQRLVKASVGHELSPAADATIDISHRPTTTNTL
jgi:hypothetical protein